MKWEGCVFQHGTPGSNQSGDSTSHQIKTEANHFRISAANIFSNKRKVQQDCLSHTKQFFILSNFRILNRGTTLNILSSIL